MNEQKPSIPITSPDESPRSPYGYNERYIHSETTEIDEFTDTLNSDRVKFESSFFSVKHRWHTGDGQPDVRRTITDITHFGISIITLTQDNTILIYHDGRIYTPINQYWIDNLADDLRRRFGSQPTHVTVKIEIDIRGNINIIVSDDDNPNQSFSVEYMYLRKAKN